MKWIVGLGNPGNPYKDTRHNIGFMAIDAIAEKWGISVNETKFKALVGGGNVRGHKVLLMKPMTYMNLSGESVRACLDFYKIDLSQLIVIYDDLDTAFGQIRLRYQGSAGGHNGIKSIIQHTNTQTFNRVRLGISRPVAGYNIADYVLSTFRKEEFAELPAILNKTCEVLDYSLEATFEQTMAKFNR